MLIALAAVLANAVDLEIVARGVKAVLAPDFFLDLGHLRREKLDGGAAIGAHHVMVAAPVKLVLISRHAVGKGHSARQSALGEKLECAIDSCKPDLGVLLAHQPEKLVGREVVPRLQKGAQDGIALVGVFEPHALQVAVEDVLGIAHGFARRRGMVVNPSLQHL